MRTLLHPSYDQIIAVLFVLLLLACGPWNQWQDINRKGRALATGVAVINEGEFLAFEAYEKLQQLPGYHLESRNSVRDETGSFNTAITVSRHDARGNRHTVTETTDGGRLETYFVDGRTYVFDTQYNGWIDLEETTPYEAQHNTPATPDQTTNMMQLLPQFGAVPTKSGQEIMQNRAVTRYELEYVTAELAEAFSDQVEASTNLHGTLWVDDESGALLRSEILLFDKSARQPRHEFVMEISQIGQVAAIAVPAPVIDLEALVSATATAQAWTVSQATLNFQGRPVTFELVPVQIAQRMHQNVTTAEMELTLRRFDAGFSPDTELTPFLTQLGQQLVLSIPQHNKVIKSDGFRVERVDLENGTVEVVYLFQTPLEEFNHVELVISGVGNPLFVPIPVINDK